jgi:hypothetical protein
MPNRSKFDGALIGVCSRVLCHYRHWDAKHRSTERGDNKSH